jgi:AcrR family transcriptional regulator
MTMTELASDDAILAGARQTLYALGYRGFSIAAVAGQLGVEPAAVAGRWGDKDALLVEVLARALAIREIRDVGDSRTELSQAIHSLIGVRADGELFEPVFLGLIADRETPEAVIADLRRRCVRRRREPAAAALRRAAARGDLPPDVDTDFVLDVWAGAIAHRRLVSGAAMTADNVQQLLDMLLSGMAPVGGPEPWHPPIEQEPWPDWQYEAGRWLGEFAFGHVLGGGADVPLRALRSAPATATINGHPVAVWAMVGRDFMPGSSSDLTVLLRVSAAGTGVLPSSLHADRIAVLNRDEVWVAPVDVRDPRNRTSRRFEVWASRGPRWEVGAPVDVVVQLWAEGGAWHLLRLPGVPIESYS